MSGKSPKKNTAKTAATKTLKEKRTDKRNKSEAKTQHDAISELNGRKR